MTDRRDDARGAGGTESDLPVRLAVLLGLVIAGLGLAGAGAALGLGDRLADTGDNPEIAVSDENITVVTDDHERTTVMDMRNVREVEITVTDDEFRIQAERGPPVTDDERERATGIVRSNETVMGVVGEFDDDEVSVRPAEALDIDGRPATNETRTPDVELEDDGGDVDVHLTAESRSDDSVTIRRQTTSDDQTVVVTIIDTGTGTHQYSLVIDSAAGSPQGPQADGGVEQYSLVVDLVTEQVVDIETEDDDG